MALACAPTARLCPVPTMPVYSQRAAGVPSRGSGPVMPSVPPEPALVDAPPLTPLSTLAVCPPAPPLGGGTGSFSGLLQPQIATNDADKTERPSDKDLKLERAMPGKIATAAPDGKRFHRPQSRFFVQCQSRIPEK